jgi:hypothetical protein
MKQLARNRLLADLEVHLLANHESVLEQSVAEVVEELAVFNEVVQGECSGCGFAELTRTSDTLENAVSDVVDVAITSEILWDQQ